MVALKVRGQDAPPSLDGGAPGRPPGDQSRVDADDFSHRLLSGVLVRPFGESEAEAIAEVVL